MRKVVSILGVIMVAGCASIAPADKNVKRKFIYDFEINSTNKDVLWTRARDYFATTFGDSRSVMRVQDKEASSLIGRGAATWKLGMGSVCATEYHLNFLSKDNKARLQLELIEGVPTYSSCAGWPWPTQAGYDSIVSGFNDMAIDLENALKSESSFSDF